MDTPEFVDQADPEDVFADLSDDTRIAILRALWDSQDEAVTFSQLREAVGMRDSGQFNYHLDKLVGPFVTSTDGGYELTQAGVRINGAIDAGSYTMGVAVDPMPLSGGCPTCGGDRTLCYEDESVHVECDSCCVTAQFGVSPSVFADCDREEVPEVAGRYLRAKFQRMTSGFCTYCDGPMEPSVSPLAESVAKSPDEEILGQAEDVPLVSYNCKRCENTATGALGLAFLDHPAVVSFYHSRGIDVRDLSVWDFAGFKRRPRRIPRPTVGGIEADTQ